MDEVQNPNWAYVLDQSECTCDWHRKHIIKITDKTTVYYKCASRVIVDLIDEADVLTCRAVSAVPFGLVKRPYHPFNERSRPHFSRRRSFCSSRTLLHTGDSNSTPGLQDGHSSGSPPISPEVTPNAPLYTESVGGGTPSKPDKTYYGSASRRAGRTVRKTLDIAPCRLPQTFLERNVLVGYREAYDNLVTSIQQTHLDLYTCRGCNLRFDRPEQYKRHQQSESHNKRCKELGSAVDIANEGSAEGPAAGRPSLHDLREEQFILGQIQSGYSHIWEEIILTVRAALQPPATSRADTPSSAKQHLILHCPREGSIHTLNTLVMHLVWKYSTNLIKIDAQDIAEIGGSYLDEPGYPPNEGLSTLGYDVHTGLNESYRTVQEPTTEDKNEVEAEDNPHGQTPLVKTIVVQGITDMFKGKLLSVPQQDPSGQAAKQPTNKDDTRKLKMENFVDTLLDACRTKKAINCAEKDKPNTNASKDPVMSVKNSSFASSPVIVLIDDYPEIYNSHNGGRVMDALHNALYERRKMGQQCLLIGTCATKKDHVVYSQPEPGVQIWGFDTGLAKTIIVPATEEMARYSSHDHSTRIRAINTRHIQDMIRRLAPVPEQVSLVVSKSPNDTAFATMEGDKTDSTFDSRVWPADLINQVATIALGSVLLEERVMSVSHVQAAITMTLKNNEAKNNWVHENGMREWKRQKELINRIRRLGEDADSETVQAKLRSQCNKHEKRLLNGVINPSSIRTTFKDVRAPKETIETLRTLTSLSLLRPDAFTYGVLATDKITGVLLYGPPGTGKTMLARAVAKESGATVLEVSGADLYNMWVGEGEKNVKAIFSLAKKLTPCIVFIDEADAILGSRGGSSNRASHRELINQFLREWDGMGELSAFIMVATNRPFDLDEATLRRLPRRMLVDLPTEKDREEILRIHLKDEFLDSEISLPKLATETPLYSGSDLKNLCVAAALACVREEYDANTAKAPSKVPPSVSIPKSSSTPTPQKPLLSSQPITPAPLPDPISESSNLPSSPQPLSTESLPTQSKSLSEALAAVSGSSGALLQSFLSVTEFITSLQKSPTPLPTASPARMVDTGQSTPSDCPVGVSSNLLVSSATSSTASVFSPSPHGKAPTPNSSSSPPPSKTSSFRKAKPSFPKRILRPRHFARALEEISASISDDMRSLKQIKKFDEKYGDRRGRKGKLGGGYGFGTLNEQERESIGQSGARVRTV
ncbi:MAG: hypothetical protein Q9213_004651 [Squamulea squamosa]